MKICTSTMKIRMYKLLQNITVFAVGRLVDM